MWLASVIAVVPGNIGLKESVVGVATVQMGVDFTVGVTASLLERVTMMVVYVGLGLLFALPVWLRFRITSRNTADKAARCLEWTVTGCPVAPVYRLSPCH